MHDRRMDHHVVVDELRWTARVSPNPANGSGNEKHIFRPMISEPVVDSRLISEIQLLATGCEDVLETVAVESPHDCRSKETVVSCDEDRRISWYCCAVHRQ